MAKGIIQRLLGIGITPSELKRTTQSAQFDGVSVVKQANVYFDGKVWSHTVLFADLQQVRLSA